MKFLYHSFILIIAFILIFAWSQTFLAAYTIQFLAFLILVYFLALFIRKRIHPDAAHFGSDGDILLLTVCIFLIITITGNIYSPIFFLLYFLGFGITFIFQPATVIVFVLGTFAIFLPEALKNGSLESYLRLASIGLIAPLAFFFGVGYQEKEREDEVLEALQERSIESGETISQDVASILTHEKNMPPEDVTKLNDILEEAQSLREETNETTE